jgi:hypothetical protein
MRSTIAICIAFNSAIRSSADDALYFRVRSVDLLYWVVCTLRCAACAPVHTSERNETGVQSERLIGTRRFGSALRCPSVVCSPSGLRRDRAWE